MSTYKTEGIIIRRNNFGESSLILDIYTKDYGKVEAVARSARKAKGKLKGHLELFLHTELILARGKNVDTITSSLTVESFSSLRNNLELSLGVYYILELADKATIEEHKDERIFCLLNETFLFLDGLKDMEASHYFVSAGENALRLKYYLAILLFQIHLASLSGFSPELGKCVFCSKEITPGKNYFSFSLGGIIDEKCAFNDSNSVLANDNVIKLTRLFQIKGSNLDEYNFHLKKCFEIIDKLKVDEKLVLNGIFLMNSFIEFNIERKIRGVDFLKKL
jgi:DNA repair protein RecO (recombination protein O)